MFSARLHILAQFRRAPNGSSTAVSGSFTKARAVQSAAVRWGTISALQTRSVNQPQHILYFTSNGIFIHLLNPQPESMFHKHSYGNKRNWNTIYSPFMEEIINIVLSNVTSMLCSKLPIILKVVVSQPQTKGVTNSLR